MSTKTPKKTAARRRTPKVTRADNPTAAKAGVKRSKPKTAYELLARVAKHILEEPKRFYQDVWLTRDTGFISRRVGAVPACQTLACRAGWIVTLHDGPIREPGFNYASRARQIIDIPPAAPDGWYRSDDVDVLFDGTACSYANDGRTLTPGTATYAREGARGIRAFMKKHAKHLKARLLKDVPKVSA